MTFTLLQAGRFVAAFMVVLYHCDKMLEQPKYYSYLPFGGLFDGGGLGVDFFFVLSGFVILTAHYSQIGRPERLRGYLVGRAIRIYPIYWIVAIAVLAPLYFVKTPFDTMIQSPAYLLKEFFLLPGDDNFVTVSWTLRHEVIFYVLFGALIFNSTLGILVIGAWFIGSATIASHGSPSLVAGWLDLRNLQFLLGMAAAFVIHHHKIATPRSLLLLGGAGFAACYLYGGLIHGDLARPGSPNVIVTAGLAAAIMIVALVELERSHGWQAPPLLRYLGDASYAIYLVHFPLFTPLVWLARSQHWERFMPLQVLMALMAAAGVAAGVLLYQFVDRPLRDLLRRALRPRDAAPRAAPTPPPAFSENRG